MPSLQKVIFQVDFKGDGGGGAHSSKQFAFRNYVSSLVITKWSFAFHCDQLFDNFLLKPYCQNISDALKYLISLHNPLYKHYQIRISILFYHISLHNNGHFKNRISIHSVFSNYHFRAVICTNNH